MSTNLITRLIFSRVLVLALISGFLNSSALAACSFTNGATAQTYKLTAPTLNPSRDITVGTVLYRGATPAIPSSGNYASCSTPGQANRTIAGAVLLSSTGGVYTYATSIDGVGIRFFDATSAGANTRYWGAGNGERYAGAWGSLGQLGVEIVRVASTGTGTGSGTLSTTAVATYSLDGLLVATIQLATSSIVAQTCTVTTPSINVEMPRTHTSDLPAVNSTFGDTAFNMGLNCDAGVKVAITITDVTNPSNVSTTLTLGTRSTASGIGYQIVNAGVPITFGPDSSAVGTSGQFVIIPSSTAGLYSIPLTGRFIRTGPLKTGSANAYATFTMSYQ